MVTISKRKDDDGDKYAGVQFQKIAGRCKAKTAHAEIHSRVVNDEFDRSRAVIAKEMELDAGC
jgi:hypothetical protein